MKDPVQTVRQAYEAPRIRELGSVQALTQADCVAKDWGSADGHTMINVSIRCAS